jgi:hypothetical protein
LHYACFCGHEGVCRLLLAAGANPRAPARAGKTPLQSAQEEGHAAVIAALTEAIAAGPGADPSEPPD